MKTILEIFSDFLKAIMRQLGNMIAAFAVGTGASAIVLWWYDLPIVLSVIGGFIVLGLALAILADSPFS